MVIVASVAIPAGLVSAVIPAVALAVTQAQVYPVIQALAVTAASLAILVSAVIPAL